MSINEKKHLVYFRGQGLVEVTAEFKKEHERECARVRMQKQYHGECICRKSQINLCDGMCVDCPFRAPGNFVSMDDPISDTDGLTRGDLIPASEDYSVEYIVTKHFLQERIAAIFSGCTATEQHILRGIACGMSERDLAEKLHMPRTTLSYQKRKLLARLRKENSDLADLL
ncbi:hypothetical protein [Alloscardovia omnicolens]|uniref:hypothetical protein n=1 Tax=Alloscardovia omnicolens TaxID=419015 RepID=UPI003A705EE8